MPETSLVATFRQIYLDIRDKNDIQAEERLYFHLRSRLFTRLFHGHQPIIWRNKEDLLHDAFVEIVRQFKMGKCHDENAALQYCVACIRNKICCVFNYTYNKKSDSLENHCEKLYSKDDHNFMYRNDLETKLCLMREAMDQLNPLRREIINRFYFQEQTYEVIMKEMDITHTKFRLEKSKGKKQLTRILSSTPSNHTLKKAA